MARERENGGCRSNLRCGKPWAYKPARNVCVFGACENSSCIRHPARTVLAFAIKYVRERFCTARCARTVARRNCTSEFSVNLGVCENGSRVRERFSRARTLLRFVCPANYVCPHKPTHSWSAKGSSYLLDLLPCDSRLAGKGPKWKLIKGYIVAGGNPQLGCGVR